MQNTNITVHLNPSDSSSAASSSSSHGHGGVGVGNAGSAGITRAVKAKRKSQKTTDNLDNVRARTSTGLEVMISVLADEELWQRARVWSVASHPIWQAHAKEYSGLKASDDIIKDYRA